MSSDDGSEHFERAQSFLIGEIISQTKKPHEKMGLLAALSLAESTGVTGAAGILADGWLADHSGGTAADCYGLPPKHPRLRNVLAQSMPGPEESQMRAKPGRGDDVHAHICFLTFSPALYM
jgi:hypothetical protein